MIECLIPNKDLYSIILMFAAFKCACLHFGCGLYTGSNFCALQEFYFRQIRKYNVDGAFGEIWAVQTYIYTYICF